MAEKRPPARVLVVDDRPEMAEMIADDLCERGYESVAVFSGRVALRMLRTERIDVLVTDLRMPHVDGIALLHASRELDPSRPVILMTAFESIDTAIAASEHGVCHYLTKPFRLDLLARLLEHAMQGG
jgi:DNA-binding NtrC family response regulator